MPETHVAAARVARPDLSIDLPVAAPFNLEATIRLLQRRPTNRVHRWDAGAYSRAVETDDGLRLLRVTNAGTVDEPAVRLDVGGGPVSEPNVARLTAATRLVLGLDAPPAPTAWLEEVEPRLAPVTQALHGFRTPCFPTLFETCASVVPFQQLSLDAGTAIVGRLVERCGQSLAVGDERWFSFPAPGAVAVAPPEDLRAIGLSHAKVATLQGIARLSADGELDGDRLRELPTPQVLAALTGLPGVGPWTASVILLRGFRRVEVFPEGDVGAARNLTALLAEPVPFTPKAASAFVERFGDRRGYLYFLALGNQLLARGLLGTPGAG